MSNSQLVLAGRFRTGCAASIPACPSAWRPPGPNPTSASCRGPRSSFHYTWSEGSFLPSTGPQRSQLRQRRSQDQAHGTAAQAEQRRHGACFPSMINAVRSSADVAQDFKDQGSSSSRTVLSRRKASASLQGPAGFCFASNLDTTQVHRKPSRTSGLLLHEQPHRKEVGCADGLKKRYMCFSRPLCETCVADSLCPANMRYLLRSDRGLVLRVTCVQSRLYVLYYRCGGEHLSSYVRTCDCLSYIYIQSASIHTMVPVHM